MTHCVGLAAWSAAFHSMTCKLVDVGGRPLTLGLFCFFLKNVKRTNSMDVPGGWPYSAMKKVFAISIRYAFVAPPPPVNYTGKSSVNTVVSVLILALTCGCEVTSQWGTTITDGTLTQLGSLCRLLRILDVCKIRHRFEEHFAERLFKSSYNQLLNLYDTKASHIAKYGYSLTCSSMWRYTMYIKILERIQRQAARFCTQNYSTGTVTQLFKDLQWDTLQTRRNIKRLSIIYQMEHNLIDMPLELDHYIQHNIDPRKHMTVSSCKLDTLQTYLETASSQQQLKNGILSPPNTVSSKSLNSYQNNLIQHFNN